MRKHNLGILFISISEVVNKQQIKLIETPTEKDIIVGDSQK